MARILDLKNNTHKSKPDLTLNRQVEVTKSIPQAVPLSAISMPVSSVEPQTHPSPQRSEDSVLAKTCAWVGPMRLHEPNIKLVSIFVLFLFAIAVLVQVFQKNIITTTFFGLLGVMIIVQAKKKPQTGNFQVSPLGAKINDSFYEYHDIKSFWLEYNSQNNIKEISFQLKRWYMPFIKIPIGDQNPVQLRSILVEFIPEMEHEDTLIDMVSRKLGI